MNKQTMTFDDQSYAAWHVLYTLVEQGEKEKALTLYRILSQSIADKAYVIQGEADMLLFFGDELYAIEKYEHAASLYYEERRFMHARGVYEHLLTINPEHHEARAYVLAIAITLDWHGLFIEHSEQLVAWHEQQSLSAADIRDIIDFLLETCDQVPPSIDRSLTREAIVASFKER